MIDTKIQEEKKKKFIIDKLEGIWPHMLSNDRWAAMKTNI